jgi:hypothetical protein
MICYIEDLLLRGGGDALLPFGYNRHAEVE